MAVHCTDGWHTFITPLVQQASMKRIIKPTYSLLRQLCSTWSCFKYMALLDLTAKHVQLANCLALCLDAVADRLLTC